MDKSCRICGHTDELNVHIFNGPHKSLAAKISAVYPIVLYENDPLPKNICKNCVYNVTCIFNGIERVVKTQSKWISNVYTEQPNHDYIRILNLIENSTYSTRNSIKITLGQDINEQCIRKVLFANCAETKEHKQSLDSQFLTSFKIDEDSFNAYSSSNENTQRNKTEIKDIKTILELNGCTLTTIDTRNAKQIPKKFTKSSPANIRNTNEVPSHSKNESIEVNTKSNQNENTDDDDEDEDNLALSEIAQRISNCERSCSSPPPLLVKCDYCPLQFNSLTILATHQLTHMQLNINKIYVKKYLHKSVRRGRLISIQNRKCIRCLNCWHVFVHNKTILDHWTLGECDFYCQICGKEFGQAPKMLREHLPAAHGISFRSSKINSQRLSMESLCSVSQLLKEPTYTQQHIKTAPDSNKKSISKSCFLQGVTTTTMIRNLDKSFGAAADKNSPICKSSETVSCYICQKVFQSMKARNSHMRKHKPLHFGSDVGMIAFENKNFDKKVETNDKCNKLNTTNPTKIHNLEQVTRNFIPHTSSIPITTNVIHGIRTKCVTRRNVANSNHVNSTNNMKTSFHNLPTKNTTRKNDVLTSVSLINQAPIETTNEPLKIIIKSIQHQQSFHMFEE